MSRERSSLSAAADPSVPPNGGIDPVSAVGTTAQGSPQPASTTVSVALHDVTARGDDLVHPFLRALAQRLAR